MARKPKRTPIEKINDELAEIRNSIETYEAAIKTMKERENSLLQELEREQIREVLELLKEKDMSIDELKEMVIGESIETEEKQSA